MLYATSKDKFRRELDGVHYEIQATDPTEMDLEVLRDRANWNVCAVISYVARIYLNFILMNGIFMLYHVQAWSPYNKNVL